MLLAVLFTVVSCTTVDPGNKAAVVRMMSGTDETVILDEGTHFGLNWLWDDAVEYDVREKTMIRKFEFNDKNNMSTKVEIAIDYNIDPTRVNFLHKGITDVEAKIEKTLKSAGKEVVPDYSAIELNKDKRSEAEKRLNELINDEANEFFIVCKRVRVTDVDIPTKIAKVSEETVIQESKNILAEKKELEQTNLAKAKIAKAKGEFEAAQYDAKTKKILSDPKMLELKKLEIEMEWAKQGASKYGNNNVFGSGTAILKNIK